MKKYIYAVILLTSIGLLLGFGIRYARTDSKEQPSLSSVEITLKDVSLEEIHAQGKGIRYEDNQAVILDMQSGAQYMDQNVQIKGRGNSSWKMPKRSYQMKFGRETSLLGMEPAKAWLLIANYADASLMRNRLIYDLAGEMMEYAPDSAYVDLWVNGEYQGNYLLCEKVEVQHGRVSLKNEKGLLVEIDNIYYYETEDQFQSPISGSHFILKDSKANDLKKEQSVAREAFAEFESCIYEFESLLYAEEKDWEAIAGLIDVESFVKYYFLEEFAQNSDSCRTSIYLYQDGPEDKLHMGPVWDLDKAVGYSQRGKYGGDPTNDYVANIQDYMGNTKELTWYMELFKIPEFKEEASQIYHGQLEDIFLGAGERIDAYQQEIRESAERNYWRWDITEIPENCDHEPYLYTSWEESVEGLKKWTDERVHHLSVTY